jgi:hypothetical protein
MTTAFIPIYYSGFWDVPHTFLTVYGDKLYYFRRGYFDEELDDYPPNYQVYLVENMKLEEAFEPSEPQFEFVKLLNITLLQENKVVGEIPTKDVIFDETKRKFINTIAFKMLKPIQTSV